MALSSAAAVSSGASTANDGISSVTSIANNGQAQVTSEAASASDTIFESNAGSSSSPTSITKTPLPLTTIYTPPASCSQIVTWNGEDFWQYGTNQTGGECYPPGFKKIFNSYYTPGICPDAWTSAGKIAHSSGHDAMCCPKSVDRSSDEPLHRPLTLAQWLCPFQTQRLRVCQYLLECTQERILYLHSQQRSHT